MKKDEKIIRVLLVGRSKEDTKLTEECLKLQQGKSLDITRASFVECTTQEMIGASCPHVIVCDIGYCSKTDLEFITLVKKQYTVIPIILFTFEQEFYEDRANSPIEVIQKDGDSASIYAYLKKRIESLANAFSIQVHGYNEKKHQKND